MAIGKYLKSGGLTALAAALAMMAMPASAEAQERGEGRWSGRGGGEAAAQGNRGSSWNNTGSRTFRGDRSAQAAQPQTQPQPQRQRNWSRGDGGGGANRPNRGEDRAASWRGRRGGEDRAQAPVRAVPQAPAQTQTERRVRGDRTENWQRGNRNYADRNYADRNYSDRNNADNSSRRREDAARSRSDGGNRWRGDNYTAYRGNRGNTWNNDNNNWRGNRQAYAQRWNRDWRRDNRYDWRGYRSSNRDAYRLNRYHAPYRNYSYRRLSAGLYLDTLFFGSRYWIDDPWQYRLPPADGPYRWVRYYDDALLVDIYSGEVIDVIYDFFW